MSGVIATLESEGRSQDGSREAAASPEKMQPHTKKCVFSKNEEKSSTAPCLILYSQK